MLLVAILVLYIGLFYLHGGYVEQISEIEAARNQF
jgi:hypothetical protein